MKRCLRILGSLVLCGLVAASVPAVPVAQDGSQQPTAEELTRLVVWLALQKPPGEPWESWKGGKAHERAAAMLAASGVGTPR